MTRRKCLFIAAALLLGLCAAALGLVSLHAPPILDDTDEMAHVIAFRSPWAVLGADCYAFWRPVKNIFFLFILHAGTAAGHLAAVAISLAAVALCWRFVRSLGLRAGWALVATAVWALSPTQVSSVSWLSGVNILMMTACCLLSLICWTGSGGAGRRALSLMAYALGLLCYEGAVVLPALLALMEWHQSRDGFRIGRTVRKILPHSLLVIVYLLVRHKVAGGMRLGNESFPPDLPAWKLSLASAWFWCDHLRTWLWPFGRQSICGGFSWPVDRLWPLQLGACWLALAGLGVVAWLARRKCPLVTFGLGWFFIAFFPMSNTVPLRCGPYGDYFLTLPGIGLAIALTAVVRACTSAAWSAAAMKKAKVAGGVIATAIILWRGAAAAEAFRWAGAWNSAQVLLERTLAARPDAYNSAVALARIYITQGRLADARRLLDEAVRESPWCSQNLFVRGQLAMAEKNWPEARRIFTEAARRRPADAYPPTSLGFIAETVDRDDAAAKKFYREALTKRWSENSAAAAINLSMILAKEGDNAGVRAVLENYLPRLGDDPGVLRNLAFACKQLGDAPAAQEYYMLYKQASARSAAR